MKDKILIGITSILTLGIVAGIGLTIHKAYERNKSYEITKSYATTKSYETQINGILQPGQPSFEGFPYNINAPAEEEIRKDPGEEERWHIAKLKAFNGVYCIQPRSSLNYEFTKGAHLPEYQEWITIKNHPDHYQHNGYGCGTSACDACEFSGSISPIHIFNRGVKTLPPSIAYIISEPPVGCIFSKEKQSTIWKLNKQPVIEFPDGCKWLQDGGINYGEGNPTHKIDNYMDTEAPNYLRYHHDIVHKTKTNPATGQLEKQGMSPVDLATGTGTISYLENTDEYAVKQFSLDYINGTYGEITFAGISDIYALGYNKDGKEVKKIPIDRINILNETGTKATRTIRYNELHFFEPEEENSPRGQKTDSNPQNYPKPKEKFEVVIKNPNKGIEYEDEENRVITVAVKVEFKYMLAYGKYTLLELKKIGISQEIKNDYAYHRRTGVDEDGKTYTYYEKCLHESKSTCKLLEYAQQYHMLPDAIRAIYRDEIVLFPGGPGGPNERYLAETTMQIGGKVWMDAAIDKEGMNLDGIYKELKADVQVNPDETEFLNDKDTLLKGIEVQLYEKDKTTGKLKPEPVDYAITDEKGRYMFYDLDMAKKYTLKFVYNGLMYQTSVQNLGLRGNTNNISENGNYSNEPKELGDRDKFNENFAEITAYPNNYKVRIDLFKKVGEYNQSWSIEELSQDENSLYYQWINRAYEIQQEKRKDNKHNILKNNPFEQAAIELGKTEELKSQLQFLMDCRMEAWTGVNGNLSNQERLEYYPKVPSVCIGITARPREEADDKEHGYFYTGEGKRTIAIYDAVKTITSEKYTIIVNLSNGDRIIKEFYRRIYEDDPTKEAKIDSNLRVDGAVAWRYQFDLSLLQDIYAATLKINGKTQVYKYNSREIYRKDSDLEGNQSTSLNGKTIKDRIWDIKVRKENDYYNNSYKRDLYKSDYFYESYDYVAKNKETKKNAENIANEIMGLKNGSELEIYVTYGIKVINTSQSILGAVTEIADYFDNTYTFEPKLSFATYAEDKDAKLNEDGTMFEANVVKDDEFYKGMAEEFNIDKTTGQTTYKGDTNDNKTILDFVKGKPIATKQDEQKLYISGLEEKKLKPGESLYVYLTFRVNRNANVERGEKAELNIADAKKNTSEINGYRTFYKDGTILPNYAGKNGYEVDSNFKAGLIDRDSTPGNVVKTGIDNFEQFEDDTDCAPNIKFSIDNEDKRKLNGSVWEDKRNILSGDAVIGNGKKDAEEKYVSGVKVQLVEIVQEKKNDEKLIEYIWDEKYTTKLENSEISKYLFESYVPGNYYVKFIYGDREETILASEDLLGKTNKNEVAKLLGKDYKELNGKSYNGQDYKSTIYQASVEQGENEYKLKTPFIKGENKINGFTNYNVEDGALYKGPQSEAMTFIYDTGTMDIEENKGKSDAKDIGSRRDEVVNYSNKDVTNEKAEILVSPYKVPTYKNVKYNQEQQEALIKELIKNTSMTAVSGIIDMEVEYNRTHSDIVKDKSKVENGTNDLDKLNEYNGNYELDGLDLGLQERPKSQLVLNKRVDELDIKDSTGRPLFNAKVNEEGKVAKVNNLAWIVKDRNKVLPEDMDNKKLLTGFDIPTGLKAGMIQPTVDEENMKGMVVKATYRISIKNEGEVDYTESEFYYTGKNGKTKSKTQLNDIIDYVDLNYRFVKDGQNELWYVIDNKDSKEISNLINQNIVNEPKDKEKYILNQYDQIIHLKIDDKNKEEYTSVPRDKEHNIKLILSQTITAEDLNVEGKLEFDNVAEIVKTSNTLGRRMAYSVVGNQEPQEEMKEIDAAKAESIKILPPYGRTKPVIYAVLGISVCAIIIAGIVVIKKKILK